MKVILLRHGSRNFTLGDVPLNDQGLAEAKALTKHPNLLDIATIICSPKKRAQMTVEPLAHHLQKPILVQESLDQMRSGESDLDFVSRVDGFLEKISQGHWPGPILLCSHSDWLSQAMAIIPSDALDLKHTLFHCAHFQILEIVDGLWVQKNGIQS